MSGWLPYGPYERTPADPLGWTDEHGHTHAGEWYRDAQNHIVWGIKP